MVLSACPRPLPTADLPIVLSASPRPPRRQPPTLPIILSQARAAHGALGRGEPADRAARAAAALPHVDRRRQQPAIDRSPRPPRDLDDYSQSRREIRMGRQTIPLRPRVRRWPPSPRSRGAPSSSSLEAAQSSRTRRAPPSSSLTQSNPLARAARHLSVGSPRCRARSPRRCGCSR